MIYLKSVIAGVVASLLASVLLTAGTFAWLWFETRASEQGQGGIGAVSVGTPLELVVLVGFVAGFVWEFRRASTAVGPPG